VQLTHGTTATVLLLASVLRKAPARPRCAGTATTKVQQSPPAPADVDMSVPPEPGRCSEQPTQAKKLATPMTTRNGLPRRVPRSLREFASLASAVPSPRNEADSGERRDRLMADLDDFSEGEHTAREGARRRTRKARRTTTGEQTEESRG
jgi:hypothetical protein